MTATATKPTGSDSAVTGQAVDRGLDLRMVGALAWILSGLFLDGWFHINEPQVETFFTPWHGVLYSGVLVAVGVLGDAALRRRRAGRRWRDAVPPGYGGALAAGALFVVGALSDMAWHELRGIEVGVEALLSPTHLLLAAAGIAIMASPLRAAALRDRGVGAGWRELWPAIVSAGFLLAQVGFFTQYAHPLVNLWPTFPAEVAAGSLDGLHAAGLAAVLVQSALLAGVLLVLVRRFTPPPGAVLAVCVIHLSFLASLKGTFAVALPAAVLAGLVGEAAVLWLRRDPRATWLLAAGVPAALFAGAFAALAVTGSLAWSLELTGGGVVCAAAVGYGLAVLQRGLEPEAVT